MAIEMRPCPKGSSNVKEIGHCPVKNVLQVRFANGSLYRYANVPRDVYDDLLKAGSIGGFISKNVRGQFEHERVDEKKDSA